jgi:hypothetical protein
MPRGGDGGQDRGAGADADLQPGRAVDVDALGDGFALRFALTAWLQEWLP